MRPHFAGAVGSQETRRRLEDAKGVPAGYMPRHFTRIVTKEDESSRGKREATFAVKPGGYFCCDTCLDEGANFCCQSCEDGRDGYDVAVKKLQVFDRPGCPCRLMPKGVCRDLVDKLEQLDYEQFKAYIEAAVSAAAAAEQWTEHEQNGTRCYWNRSTDKSQWERPQELTTSLRLQHINCFDGLGRTLLHRAVDGSIVRYSNNNEARLKVVQLLLKHGADPNSRLPTFGSVLHSGFEAGLDWPVVRAMCENDGPGGPLDVFAVATSSGNSVFYVLNTIEHHSLEELKRSLQPWLFRTAHKQLRDQIVKWEKRRKHLEKEIAALQRKRLEKADRRDIERRPKSVQGLSDEPHALIGGMTHAELTEASLAEDAGVHGRLDLDELSLVAEMQQELGEGPPC